MWYIEVWRERDGKNIGGGPFVKTRKDPDPTRKGVELEGERNSKDFRRNRYKFSVKCTGLDTSEGSRMSFLIREVRREPLPKRRILRTSKEHTINYGRKLRGGLQFEELRLIYKG